MDAKILHDKLFKDLNQLSFLRDKMKNGNYGSVLFFIIYKINCNSNEEKERRKGVDVLTIRKIDGVLHVKNNHK